MNHWILGGIAGLLVVGSVAAPYSLAQTENKAGAQTQFEVATVRPTPANRTGMVVTDPVGPEFHGEGLPLIVLIQMAFDVQQSQISGPDWIKSQHYDIAAKTEGGVSLTYEQMKPLLQNLLAERFKLAVHYGTKDVSGYGLVVAKGGPKLQATKEGASKGGSIRRDGIQVPSATMKVLASMLSYPLGQQPVVDKTGIEGYYEVKLSFAPQDATDSTLPSIFTAVQEQLGLKLESAKVPVEMLVIDHVEKVPTEN